MSAESAALPLRRFERAGLPIPINCAAFVTDMPAGMTSALMRKPGWTIVEVISKSRGE
ncbi:hypothetical protein ES707_19247 [subsurface metagenome]